MQYNKVEICGINTSQLKVMKEAEKLELLKKAHAGDKQAREDLINGKFQQINYAIIFIIDRKHRILYNLNG